jgi:hypothetical protein
MVSNERLRVALDNASLSQEQFARDIGVCPKQVGRWVTKGTVPYRRNQRAAADRLGVDHRFLWPRRSNPQAETTVGDVDRREMLTAVGGAVMGAVVASARPAFASPKDVPPELAGFFADQLAAHAAANVRLGAADVLVRTVATQYAVVREAADIAPGTVRSDFLGLAVGYADFAGWLHQDRGDRAQAAQWRNEALVLAHRTRDPNLVGYALARMAFLHVDAGDGPGALDLSHAALATPRLAGPARVYALRVAAQANALMGRRGDADRVLDEAAMLSDRSDTQAQATGWVDVTTQETHRATCYGRLGAPEAPALLSAARDVYPLDAHRARGIITTRLAAALLDGEGPDAALAPTVEAVGCLERAPSGRLRHELAALRAKAANRQDSTAGLDLYEALMSV